MPSMQQSKLTSIRIRTQQEMNKSMSTISNFAVAFGCCSILSGLTPVNIQNDQTTSRHSAAQHLDSPMTTCILLTIALGWCHDIRRFHRHYRRLSFGRYFHLLCGPLACWNLQCLSCYRWPLHLGCTFGSSRVGAYHLLAHWLVQLAWLGRFH